MVNYVEKVQSRTLLSSILGLDETYYARPLTQTTTIENRTMGRYHNHNQTRETNRAVVTSAN